MLLRVLDLETTGFEPPAAGIVEIGWCDLIPAHADREAGATGWWVDRPEAVLVNPGHPIPPETSAIHHIIDADVASARPFAEVWPAIVGPKALTSRDQPIAAYVAHNAAFERKFITAEMTGGVPWVCTYKCALRAWPDAPGHSNGTLRYWLQPRALVRERASAAHRAGPDAYVTAFLMRELLALHTLDQIIAWSAEPALQIRCGFGKTTRGMLWTQVDLSFLYWVLDRDFGEDVHFTVRHELDRREKAWEAEERARVEAAGAPAEPF